LRFVQLIGSDTGAGISQTAVLLVRKRSLIGFIRNLEIGFLQGMKSGQRLSKA